MRFRLRTLLTVAALLPLVLGAFSANFLALPLRDSDKADAARSLVAWIVEGRSVPGFRETYPDARWMPGEKRFFVICDFLPPEMSVSDDSRVQRITRGEYDDVFKKHGFDDTDYITIELRTDSRQVLVFEFSNSFGPLAAHGYRFEFRRKLWGLRSNGKFLWVS